MDNKQLMFYQKSLSINRENLDEDLANFPSLFYTVSDHYLEAVKHTKRLQQRLDIQFAAIASGLRSAAQREIGKKGVKPYTETQIKQEVLLHPKYRKARAKHSDAVYIQDRWSALKDAFIQKSFSLKGLVSLAVSENYQSESAIKPDRDSRRGRRRRK